MQICKYLESIQAGKAINFDSFRKQLNQSGYSDQTLLGIFSVEKTAKSVYRVKVIDDKQFAQLQADFPDVVVNNRVSAAQSGNSHKHRVSQAMIILWAGRQEHPVVILNDADGIHTPTPLGRHLLIIENQENFVQKPQSLAFLKQQFQGFNDRELDIAWGAGNSISNRLNKAFFNHYEHIDCWLDLDIGGLGIFANIYELSQHPQLQFLLPPCADEHLKKSNIALQHRHLPMLRKYYGKYPQLRPTIKLMLSHQKMLEQENYLTE